MAPRVYSPLSPGKGNVVLFVVRVQFGRSERKATKRVGSAGGFMVA